MRELIIRLIHTTESIVLTEIIQTCEQKGIKNTKINPLFNSAKCLIHANIHHVRCIVSKLGYVVTNVIEHECYYSFKSIH